MNKTFDGKKYILIVAMCSIGFFLPIGADATTTMYVELENPVMYEGDIFLADVTISTPDTSINVVDGTILYDSNKLEIKEVSTGNSLLALWPKPPVFSNKNGSLSFAGGILGGFQGKNGDVLRIVFLAKSEGEAHIDFLEGFAVFLHDGEGTRINPLLRSVSLDIVGRSSEIPVKDEWRDLVAKDTTPPESFEITLGKDPSIFDNQYFISFFTTDAQSGIAYYEVQEGERDFIRAESPYVLQDQSLKTVIQVKAIDNAGNERIETMMSAMPFYQRTLSWIGAILIIVIVITSLLWKSIRRKK